MVDLIYLDTLLNLRGLSSKLFEFHGSMETEELKVAEDKEGYCLDHITYSTLNVDHMVISSLAPSYVIWNVDVLE